MQQRWKSLVHTLACAACASLPLLSVADYSDVVATRTPVADKEGRRLHMFVLDEGYAGIESDVGESPARSPMDPANATDIYGWHRPKVRALVKRLESTFQISAHSMTSWAMPTFSAFVSDATVESMRGSRYVREIVPVFSGDISPSAWNDSEDNGEIVSWGKIAIGTDDLSSTTNLVYLLDGIAHASVDLDDNCPNCNLIVAPVNLDKLDNTIVPPRYTRSGNSCSEGEWRRDARHQQWRDDNKRESRQLVRADH